jgi:hypothetical protein
VAAVLVVAVLDTLLPEAEHQGKVMQAVLDTPQDKTILVLVVGEQAEQVLMEPLRLVALAAQEHCLHQQALIMVAAGAVETIMLPVLVQRELEV